MPGSRLKRKSYASCRGENCRNLRFHELMTTFDDNVMDPHYGHLGFERWKFILKRRSFNRLPNALVIAYSIPHENHAFTGNLRQTDASFQEVKSARRLNQIQKSTSSIVYCYTLNHSDFAETPAELTVLQGGTEMDLMPFLAIKDRINA